MDTGLHPELSGSDGLNLGIRMRSPHPNIILSLGFHVLVELLNCLSCSLRYCARNRATAGEGLDKGMDGIGVTPINGVVEDGDR